MDDDRYWGRDFPLGKLDFLLNSFIQLHTRYLEDLFEQFEKNVTNECNRLSGKLYDLGVNARWKSPENES